MEKYLSKKMRLLFTVVAVLISEFLFAQGNQISGSLTDGESGEPVIGAAILQKGTNNGVISDINGKFQLKLDPSADQTILVSFVGYTSEEVDVTGKSKVEIILVPDIQSLGEVVVIGYGSQKKEDVTGAVGIVSSKKFDLQPIPRMENMLQGRVAGVEVTQNSGAPGASINIRIRGTSSYGANSQPVYVIDGVIGGDINTLNPNDIESISVLKDASSSAIYGAFGANGVVIITTKKGSTGGAKFNVRYTHGVSQLPRKHDLLNAADYMALVKEKQLITDSGIDPNNPNDPKLKFTDNDIRAALLSGKSTDWQDEIFRMGQSKNLQLSLSGGTDKSNYYFSAGYNTAEGIVENSSYNRINLRFKYAGNLIDRLTWGVNINNDFEKLHNSSRDNGGRSNIINTALGYAPTEPVRLEDGSYSLTTDGYGYVTRSNPVWMALEPNDDDRTNNLQGILSLKYDFTDHLSLETKVISRLITGFDTKIGVPSPDRIADGDIVLSNGTVLTPASANSATVNNSTKFYFQNTTQLNYKRTFGNHNITALLGSEFFKWNSSSFEQTSSNFEKTNLGYYAANVTSADYESNNADYKNEAWLSFLARANYSYMDKYLLTATYRKDGSSRLYNDNKWDDFWSLSAGYRITEDFFKGVSWLEDMKLRVGYGQTGNRAVDIYETQVILKSTQYSFNTGSEPGSIYKANNSKVSWETVNTWNAGLDVSLFNGRVQPTFDAYYKKSSDLIFPVILPWYFTGVANQQNVGEIENKGIEIGLNLVPLDNGRDFKVTNVLTFTVNRNKLLKTDLRDSLASGVNDPQTLGNSHWNIIGQQLGLYKGLICEGIWQQGEDIPNYASVGDLKYRDVNGDGILNEFDAVTIGSSRPKFSYGFVTDVSYKNFSLNIVFQGVVGRDVYNFGKYYLLGGGAGILNGTSVELNKRWTPQNTDTDIPAFTKTSLYVKNSTYFIEDASFLKARNITLSYDLSKNILERMKLSNMRVFAGVQNAFTITKYSGYDPESFNNASGTGSGIDEGSYPTPRTYTVGVNIGF